MSAEVERRDRLRSYLLGTLPEGERERLEVELLRDDDLYEQLLAMEDEAVHDAVQGGAATAELAPIVDRLRRSEAGRRRLAAAGELVDGLAASRSHSRPVAPAFWLPLVAAAVFLLIIGVVWFLSDDRPQQREARPPGAPPAGASSPAPVSPDEPPVLASSPVPVPGDRPAPAPNAPPGPPREASPPSAATMVALALSPGLVRGEGEARRVELAPGVGTVRVTLALPPGPAPVGASYRAALTSAEGRELWSRGGLRAAAGGAHGEVRVEIPARVLPEGDYELGLERETPGGAEPLAEYAFGVLRKP